MTKAIFFVRTVMLINHNRIFNIYHDCMLKKYVPNKTSARSPPRFYSHPILSTSKCHSFNCHILHIWLFKFLPKTPNAAPKSDYAPKFSYLGFCIWRGEFIIIFLYSFENLTELKNEFIGTKKKTKWGKW